MASPERRSGNGRSYGDLFQGSAGQFQIFNGTNMEDFEDPRKSDTSMKIFTLRGGTKDSMGTKGEIKQNKIQ